ncbi:Predicted arabinose efflux permease, MFS family [Rhizobiales bacterium GAS113]|nr:Predicted arabinose efflux permease, MFS family [Rhizobiales bacterium GAS113]
MGSARAWTRPIRHGGAPEYALPSVPTVPSPMQRSFLPLLFSVFLLVTGNGVLSTLIPWRARLEGFSDITIGFVGSSYFAGMLLGSLVMPRIVQRIDQVRAFVSCVLMGAAAILSLPWLIEPWSWVLLRGLIGLSLAGLYGIAESWFSGKSDNAHRGSALGLYSVVQYLAWSLGNQIFRLSDPDGWLPFVVSAAIVACATFPLLLAPGEPPRRPAKPSLRFGWLFRMSPVGFVGALLIGASNGPFWSLTPVFAADLGLSANEVAMLMTAFMLGSAALQVPIGKLSDEKDRRTILVSLCLASGVMETLLAQFGGHVGVLGLYALAFALGSVISTQYYVAAAHAVDRTGSDNAVTTTSALLFLYSIGAISGPPIASYLMTYFGPGALYGYTALVHLALIAFTLRQMLYRPPPALRTAEGRMPQH